MYIGLSFLCCPCSIATQRDNFVRGLSVRLSHSYSYVSQATHAFLRMLPLFFIIHLYITIPCDKIFHQVLYHFRFSDFEDLVYKTLLLSKLLLPTWNAYSSGYLVPSNFWLAYVETNYFTVLLVIFQEYSLRTSLGIFSIMKHFYAKQTV